MEDHKINFVNYPSKNFFKQYSEKKAIVLHHTVSTGNADIVINYWKKRNNGNGKIATHFVIQRDGKIYQLFNTKYWAYHIGNITREAKRFFLKPLNISKYTIGIELINAGGLKKINGKFFDAYNRIINTEIEDLGFEYRGYRYFEKYTEQQLESAIWLVKILANKWNIPLKYDHKLLFNVNAKALSLEPGLYTHASFRSDKSDLAPQRLLIDMLKKNFEVIV